MKRNIFKDSDSILPKWLTLKNAIALSYYSYAFLSSVQKVLEGGDIPLPRDLEQEFKGNE